MPDPWRPIKGFDLADGIDVDVLVSNEHGQFRIPDVLRSRGKFWLRGGRWIVELHGITHFTPRPDGTA